MLLSVRTIRAAPTALALGFVLFFGGVMLWPALLNRYPLIDWDSNAYVETITHWRGLTRPFPYSVFLLLTSFHRSAWGTIAAQAVLVSILIWFTVLTVWGQEDSLERSIVLRAEGSAGVLPRRILILAMIVMIACGASSLPYYTSLIMPDLFTVMTILSFFVLLYTRSRFQAGFVFALLALSISIHGSNAPILALLGCWWVFSRRRQRWLLAWAAVGLGLLLGGAIHKSMTGKFYWQELGSTVLFARLVQDGLVQRTLEASCPERPNAFCAYTQELRGKTSDEYLFLSDSVKFRIGNERGAAERAVIFRSLRLFPVENALAVWRHFVRGLELTIDTYWPLQGVTPPFRGIVKAALPADVKAFERAVQTNREYWFAEPRPVIMRLTWIAILLSLAGAAYLLVSRHRPKVLISIVIGLAGGVVSNALIMSSTANDYYGRYFSRVNGLIFLIAALLIGNAIRDFSWRGRPVVSKWLGRINHHLFWPKSRRRLAKWLAEAIKPEWLKNRDLTVPGGHRS